MFLHFAKVHQVILVRKYTSHDYCTSQPQPTASDIAALLLITIQPFG